MRSAKTMDLQGALIWNETAMSSIYLSIYLSVGININVCNLFLASADVGSISKQIRVTTIQPVSDASLLRSETNATQTGAACACAGL
jgi:hypothetical protein